MEICSKSSGKKQIDIIAVVRRTTRHDRGYNDARCQHFMYRLEAIFTRQTIIDRAVRTIATDAAAITGSMRNGTAPWQLARGTPYSVALQIRAKNA